MVLANPKYRTKACIKACIIYSRKAQDIVAAQDMHKYKTELQDTLPSIGM